MLGKVTKVSNVARQKRTAQKKTG